MSKSTAFTKIKKFNHICESCGCNYISADIKGRYCLTCKQPKKCKCGCSNIVKTPGRYYAQGCQIRGKSYKEIHGTENPPCGYQSGDMNVAKRPHIRKKISEGVKRSYTTELRTLRREQCFFLKQPFLSYVKNVPDKSGQLFRSKFEASVSDMFTKYISSYKYTYHYEKSLRLYDGSLILVDFLIDDCIIEVTGYAFDSWKDNFDHKLSKTMKSLNNPIIVICMDKHKTELMNRNRSTITHNSDISIISISQLENKLEQCGGNICNI